jgi:lysine/ornithine N-monooxygenase
MSFWRQMPVGMKLRSNMSATNMVEPVGPLSLKRYMDETGEEFDYPVRLEHFIDYGTWVQRRAVPDVDTRTVVRLAAAPEGFVLDLADGERLTARRVVVACGIAPFAHLPAGFGHLPAECVSHTSLHRDMSLLAGRRVAVVGGGQSAFESAALLHEAGAQAEVLVRSRDVVWLRKIAWKTRLGLLGPIVYAPTDVGPAWYSRLVASPDLFRRLARSTQDRIAYRSIRPACSDFVAERLDGVEVTLGVTVTEAKVQGNGFRLELSDGTARDINHLMFGTGYRVDMRRYAFLDTSMLAALQCAGGYPVLGRGLESSVPGLHIVGAPAARSFGPIMRFVSGSWYAGRAVARALAAASRSSRILVSPRS